MGHENIGVRIGRGFGELVEQIQNAKRRVWVMSPWISPEYARMLVKKALEGASVRIFTTNDLENASHVKALMELIDAKRVIIKPAIPLARRLGLILLILGLVTAFIVLPAGALILIAGIAIYLVWGRDKLGIRYFSGIGEGLLYTAQSPSAWFMPRYMW